MYARIGKNFGGLSKAHYARHFIFGLIIATCVMWVYMTGHYPNRSDVIAVMVLDTVLYPYSRFVYEGVVAFIVGNHEFFFDLRDLVAFKMMTMALCWLFAVVLGPIGLVYLYFRHGKSQ